MEQRRVRLGDILDDYCSRERRVTNHVVVAMIDDEVKQTRCTTCEADHAYKHAKVPTLRRKQTLPGAPGAAVPDRVEAEGAAVDDEPAGEPPSELPSAEGLHAAPATTAGPEEAPAPAGADEEGPVHRRLIRATLPRQEGQTPERREPEFTIRQPGFRGRPFDGSGQRPGRPPMRTHGGSQPQRFDQPPRHGSGQGPRHGSGHGPGGGAPGHRPGGNRPAHPGGPRGPRPGGGRGGRKRGR